MIAGNALARLARRESGFVAGAGAAAAAGVVLLVLVNCWRGFDFSDEGAYFNWMANAWSYAGSNSQYGYLLAPLYHLAGESVGAMRAANLVITLALASALFAALLRESPPRHPQLAVAAAAFALATATLAFTHRWLISPSYNTLNLQGLLLAAIGLALLADPRRGVSRFAAVLLGAGGWITWMAKPTTAVALAPLALLGVLALARRRAETLALAAATAAVLLLAGALAIDGGSLPAHVARYRDALAGAREISDAYALSGVGPRLRFDWRAGDLAVFEKIFAAALGGAAFALVGGAPAALLRTAAAVIGASAAAFLAVRGLPAFLAGREIAPMQTWWLAAPSFGVLAGLLMTRLPALAREEGWRGLALALVLALFPVAYAAGTGNNYWFLAADAAALWVAAALALAAGVLEPVVRMRIAAALGLATVLFAALMARIGLDHPYRQPAPIPSQNEWVAFGPRGRALALDRTGADYVRALREGARAAGMAAGAPAIDLTGRHPGAVFAVGATAPGVAWLISGYPASGARAARIIGAIPCAVLARAFVLDGPGAPLRLPPETLRGSGLDPEADYRLAARAVPPTGLGEHVLLAPKLEPAEAEARCRAARGEGAAS